MASRRLALWALLVIFLANFLNYTDRQLVSALEEPLRTALALDEVEHGLLWTLFTLGYMLCAVPIGFLADRVSRTRLFALCIIIWSLATILSGMAWDKHILYIARVLIGVGEAGCLVVGPSLVVDFFQPKVRGKALAVFYLGLPLGGAMAFVLAGLVLEDLSWRQMFYLAGAPGFLIAVFIWVLPEPDRGASEEGGAHGHGAGGSWKDYFQLLKTPTLMLIILAQAFGVFILIPLIHYGVEFFVSMRGMSPKDARLMLGAIALAAGLLGSIVSGVVGDWLAKRMRGAYALLAGVGYLASLPCLLAGFWMESKWVYLGAVALGCFFIFMCMPAVNTQIANVSRPAQRATAWALAVFILHLLGDTASPLLFGYTNQQFGGLYSAQLGVDSEAVRAAVGQVMTGSLEVQVSYSVGRQWAFTWFAFALVPASLCCFLAALTARSDMKRLEPKAEPTPHEEVSEPGLDAAVITEAPKDMPPT